jgi:CubicO group peptidase (beta-lactamase class C family)
MNRISHSCVLMVLLASCAGSNHALPLSTPEAQGVSSKALLEFVQALESQIDAPHSLVLLRHGRVIAQGGWDPFDPADNHMLYSLSKSFTSTAVGMAADEGLLSVRDPVLSFFSAEGPANPGENLRAMTVHDLLTMNTGHARDTTQTLTQGSDPNWPRAFLALPVEHKPGTHFLYNTGATYMCSAIVQKATGQTVLDYLRPRLFEPLGIDDPRWEADPQGISVGGWGLMVTTMDIAKFGQLYLQKGMWNGRQLISRAWVEQSTSALVPNGDNPQSDWNQGYGYQFWQCRHGAYRGDGAFGQFCIVMPGQDAVLAITSGVTNMQQVLDVVWQYLLPALGPAALPADRAAHQALERKLAGLAHAPVAGQASSPIADALSGRRFVMQDNPLGIQEVTFDFTTSPASATIQSTTGRQHFQLGYGRWHEQVVPFTKLGLPIVATTGPQRLAASAAWVDDHHLAARAWLRQTPYRLDAEFHFDPTTHRLTLRQKLHPLQTQWLEAQGQPLR